MKKCSVDGCDRAHHAHGYCGMHEQRFRRYGRTDFAQKTYTKEYFEMCIEKSATGCWLWKRVVLTTGYGQFFKRLAHRVSYEFYVGAIPAGKVVLHTCDVRNCVNPDHLRIGSHQDNTNDMMSKSRHRFVMPPKGVLNPSTKFSESDVAKIRELLKAGQSMRSIGRMFGAHHKTISNIANGVRYVES